LYIPNNLSIRYSTNWNDVSAFVVAAAGAGVEAIGNLAGIDVSKYLPNMRGLPNSRSGGVEDSGLVVGGIEAGTSVVLSEAENTQIKALNNQGLEGIGVAMGLAPNPMKEQKFNGVEFRQFSMNYSFSPRNKDEAQEAINIIRLFKQHMHPHFMGSKFLYKYPSEFDIKYMFKDKENSYIHKHTSCILEDMSVNYTPDGVFTTFPNGMPTKIDITLVFKELMQITKETIALGM
jgi:hypothetical protein